MPKLHTPSINNQGKDRDPASGCISQGAYTAGPAGSNPFEQLVELAAEFDSWLPEQPPLTECIGVRLTKKNHDGLISMLPTREQSIMYKGEESCR